MNTFKFHSYLLLCGILLISVSCQDKKAREALIRLNEAEIIKERNIELARKFYKFLDELNFDTLRAIVDPTVRAYSGSGDPVTFAEMEPYIKMFYNAFPDYKHQIDDIYASDDKVVVILTYTGTRTNDFMDLKPAGNNFKYKGIQMFQFSDSKVLNFWSIEDQLGLMTQLGMELKPKV